MAARLLAFVAAVAMVVGAVVVRDRLDDDGSADPGGGPDNGDVLRLVCSSELEQVCRAIEEADDSVVLVVEPSPATIDRLGGGQPADVDAWFAAGAWPEALNSLGDPVFDRGTTLGRTPIVIAWWNDRPQLPCRPVTLACADKVRLAAPPDSSGAGVLVDAALAGEHIGNRDFATNDLEGEASDWLTGVDRAADDVRARNPSMADFSRFLALGAAAPDAYADLESAVGIIEAAAAARDRVDIERTPAVVDAVIAPRRGSRAGARLVELAREARGALRSAGWRVEGGAPLAGIGTQPLPADDGLPSPGVLHAVRDLVQ